MAMEANAPFLWGAGGRRLTPEEILMERKAASTLGTEAMSTTPVGHWSQGLNRVLQGLMAGYDGYSADQASKQNGTESAAVIQALLGGGAAPAAAAPVAAAAPTGAPMAASPMGTMGIPAGKDEFVNSIMPMAQEASAKTGLDPRLIVAQAALESGWGKSAPGNNLFGIKSHGVPGGNTLATTEVVNGQPVSVKDSFRAYASPADSVKGYADFITQNPRYEPVRSAQGLEAQVAALGQSGYATDPAYAQKVMQIAQGLPAPAGGAPVPTSPAAAARPAINPAIVRAISSPYMSDSAKKIGTMLFQNNLEQQQKASDPLRQAQLAKLQQELTPLAAPTVDAQGNLIQTGPLGKVNVLRPAESRPTSVSEYEYYKKNLPQGEKPMAYDTWATAKARAGAMNVSNNVSTGTIPQGYEQFTDPETKAIRMRPIPGGPKDPTKSDQAKADSKAVSTDVVTNAANLARMAMETATLPTTGTAGKMLSGLGETGAAELNRQINVLTANAKVENLNAMRQASPTGGALGAVSDSENAMMAAKSGALDPGAPKAQFQRALEDYERTLLRVVHGKEQGDAIFSQTRKSGPQTAPVQNGMTATNPQTGEKIMLRDGKWVPFS